MKKIRLFLFIAAQCLLALVLLSGCSSNHSSSSSSSSSHGTPPSPPFWLAATAGNGTVTIEWTASEGATSYNLYWSTSAGVAASREHKLGSVSTPLVQQGLVNGVTYYYVVTAVSSAGEGRASAEVLATPLAPSSSGDPLYADQWHLKNTGQTGADGVHGLAGEDINVEPVWLSCGPGDTCRGESALIAVVDEDLEIAHEDLAANIAPGLSYNYLTGGTDPTASTPDDVGHGTMVAGIVGARDDNGRGGRGVAPRARLAGYNVLQDSTESNIADAMVRNSADVSVSTNSWGAPDGAGFLNDAPPAWRTAVDSGLAAGRNGLGTVYTFAAGNGAPLDNANNDGLGNYRGVMAVAALTDRGTKASYSERGANLWISAPAGEFCDTHTITTTDRTGTDGLNSAIEALYGITGDYAGNVNYTRCMNGTSSATPMVAGAAALMVQANPSLTWRDVRLLLAATARKNDPSNSEWTTNGAGYHVNHNYGFGAVDAAAAVSAARVYTDYRTGAQKTFTASRSPINIPVPDGSGSGFGDEAYGAEVSDVLTVAGSGISQIEYAVISFASDHTYGGDLRITLRSPAGTVSILAEPHVCMDTETGNGVDCGSYFAQGWDFGSARHLGEAADGQWTIFVSDAYAASTGAVQGWSLTFYGR